jgi:hypothetical protein
MGSSNPAGDGRIWSRVGLNLALALAILVAVTLATTLRLAPAAGEFVYSLDDPYIHLAVAEEILRGGYGVNAGEAAAASSSPIYPVVLAGLLALGMGSFGPLALALAATAAALAFAVATWRAAGLTAPPAALGRLTLVGCVFLLALNVVGLAFTGMEHSLQTACALAALFGAVRFARAGRLELWWLAVLAAQTLVRYEGLAIAAAGAALLIFNRRPLAASAVLAGATAILAAFGLLLMRLGLPPAPSSVLVKGGDLAAQTGLGARIGALVEHALANIGDQAGLAFLAFSIGFFVVALRKPTPGVAAQPDPALKTARAVALFAAIVLALHLLVGRFGWWQRYETYALILAAVAAPIAFPVRFHDFIAGKNWPALLVPLLIIAMAYQRNVSTTLESGPASRNVFLQQYQMHRFVADYLRMPVAVNDLGFVSYANPDYVLDLWGLGSEAAREARARRDGPAWMESLALQKGVVVAMVYASWFPDIPASWRRIGVLDIRDKLRSVSDSQVAFYLTDPAAETRVRAALVAWSSTLPKKAVFVADPGFAVAPHPPTLAPAAP